MTAINLLLVYCWFITDKMWFPSLFIFELLPNKTSYWPIPNLGWNKNSLAALFISNYDYYIFYQNSTESSLISNRLKLPLYHTVSYSFYHKTQFCLLLACEHSFLTLATWNYGLQIFNNNQHKYIKWWMI